MASTKYRSGETAESQRQELMGRHLGLVHHVARQIASRLQTKVELDELVSAGTLGLIQAIETFDTSRGHSFSTFAVPRIRGAILDELRRQDRVPRSLRRKARGVTRARNDLQTQLGRLPTAAELALRLGITPSVLSRWEHEVEGSVHISLDRSVGMGDELVTAGELCTDRGAPHVDDLLTMQQETFHVRSAIRTLNAQEQKVLALYYFGGMKLQEIGIGMGLSACRISQIRTGALAKLRGRLWQLRAA